MFCTNKFYMKKIYLFTLFTALAIITKAQLIELTPLMGHSVNGNLRTFYGSYDLDNTSNFGGVISIEAARGVFMELLYSRNETKFHYYNSGSIASVDMTVEHYQFGSLEQFGTHKIIKPFAALSVGVSRFHPKDNLDNRELYDLWAFTPILSGGVKLLITDWLGIRLQGRFILPFHFNVGSGHTAGNGGLIGIPSVSGDFLVGLILRFRK